MAKLLATTLMLYLATLIATATATHADGNDHIVTWNKPGIRYRARSVTIQPQTVTVVETHTTIPSATLQLRSLPSPAKKRVKRAFLNIWSYQGCIADDEHLPALVSPFPYQLSSADVSGASCMHFCDDRGNSFAALQNGNECWCGEEREALNVTLIEKARCDVPCAAQPGEMCGGRNSLTVYSKAG